MSDWRARLAAAPPGTAQAAKRIIDGLKQLSPEGREKLQAHLQASIAQYEATHKLETTFPATGPLRRELYRHHMAFFAATAKYTEVLCAGGNRTGKTTACSFAMALFLTGKFELVPWWPGRRWNRPIVAWACATDFRVCRETVQAMLLGAEGHPGTGMIPASDILSTSAKVGTPGGIDVVLVRHVSGGTSRLMFKAYESGRESFASAKCDVIWADEEPPDIGLFSEMGARLTSTVPGERPGLLMLSMTPLKGLSEITLRFLPGGRPPGTAT
jgi:phage terminase large subunit-like protein